jgi:hypothetical protein
MRYKVIFYPMYEETLVIESLLFDNFENGVDYTHHYTLKTPKAASWSASSRLRELADRLEIDQF